MTQWSVAGLLARTTEYLAGKHSTSARLDAELLLAECLGVERIELYTQPDRPLTTPELDAYRGLVARRARHEPVAYILGRAHFRYLTLKVTPDVLIPRPETEELVDAVLIWLKERPLLTQSAESATAPLIADVGTGSGAIALSLAREAGVRVLATDVSAGALSVARHNREALDPGHLVELREADLLAGVDDGSLRVVLSNPPYIAEEVYETLAPDVRSYEPAGALRAGPGGLDVYRRLMPQAARTLGPGGALFVEVGIGQAGAVVALAREAGFCSVTVLRDLTGRERIVRAVRPGAIRATLDSLTMEEAASAGSPTAAVRAALAGGAIVGLPTDTVYGLAAAWDSARGVRALFEAKGRAEDRPVQVLFSSVEAVLAALPDLDDAAARVLEALLPGPYTFLVGTSVPRPPLVGTPDSLGVRVPDLPELLGFLQALGVPVAATSANRTGMGDPATADEVDPEVLSAVVVALIPGAGSTRPSSGGVASTVVDLRPLAAGGEPAILREGVVPAAQVRERVAGLRRG